MATVPPTVGIAATVVGIRQAVIIPLMLVYLLAIVVSVMEISVPVHTSEALTRTESRDRLSIQNVCQPPLT